MSTFPPPYHKLELGSSMMNSTSAEELYCLE